MVSIILILIAIGLPRYNAALLRARVTVSTQEVWVLLTALESYQIDWQVFPMDHNADWPYSGPDENGFVMLTTPIPYLKTWLYDPFGTHATVNPEAQGIPSSYYGGSGSDNEACGGKAHYANRSALAHGPDCAHAYIVFGIGPDKERSVNPRSAFPSGDPVSFYPVSVATYTPTNGTRSKGDIYRLVGDWRRRTLLIDGLPQG